jgi:hypothetical protein
MYGAFADSDAPSAIIFIDPISSAVLSDTMRNRTTDLIEWNDSICEGVGCSGTHYTLSYDHPADDPPHDGNARGHWLIVVNGSALSSARSVQDALARSEGLEALRCILQGRCDQISDEHCRVAELLACEMLEAATEALSRSLRPADRGDLLRNVDALEALSSAIRLECLHRQRESSLNASPPLN